MINNVDSVEIKHQVEYFMGNLLFFLKKYTHFIMGLEEEA